MFISFHFILQVCQTINRSFTTLGVASMTMAVPTAQQLVGGQLGSGATGLRQHLWCQCSPSYPHGYEYTNGPTIIITLITFTASTVLLAPLGTSGHSNAQDSKS